MLKKLLFGFGILFLIYMVSSDFYSAMVLIASFFGYFLIVGLLLAFLHVYFCLTLDISSLLKMFLLGFDVAFIPFLIPNGLILALPFTILVMIAGAIQFQSKSQEAMGLILGGFAAFVIGECLFFLYGYGYYPV